MSILDLLKASGRWAVIVAGFLLAAEATARIEDALTWHAPMGGRFTEEALIVRDSLGAHGNPNYSFKKWRMNNLGFRGADITAQPTPGKTRIVTLGASETFGLHESPQHEYPVQLQQLLDSTAPGRYEVVNVGLPGLSLSSMVPYYRNVVSPLHPAWVFIYPSPSFYLEVNPLPPVYQIPRVSSNRAAEKIEWRLPARGRESLKAIIPAAIVTRYRQWKLDRQRASHPADWVWQAPPADRLESMRQHLGALVDSIQLTGARVVLITHTNRFVGAESDTATADRRHLTNLIAEYYPRASLTTMATIDRAANGVVREVASSRDIPVIDAEGKITPDGAHFGDYAHFTDSGAAQMARLLADNFRHIDTVTTAPAAP